MRLLIVTQKVDKNDPILGFFHGWLVEFAKHFESIVVICLEQGQHELPANVRVLSLGKESGHSRSKYIHNFYRFIWRERKNYDAVLVHMNPIYVVLGGSIWNMLGKKVSLWYTHKNVDWKLRIAEKFVTNIFSASKESFRLSSRKLHIMGHGIDVDLFRPSEENSEQINSGRGYESDSQKSSTRTGPLRSQKIISVSRISETKNQLNIIKAFEILQQKGFAASLDIIGGPVTPRDFEYEKSLKRYIHENKILDIKFAGNVKPENIVDIYRSADIFINLSSTGSIDKAILEAMACGLKIVTSNEAFKNILDAENLTDGSPRDLAEKIEIISARERTDKWREYVVREHSLRNLIGHISQVLLESDK
jgi:glycosyltransferase involved in cell wall biosynthesis